MLDPSIVQGMNRVPREFNRFPRKKKRARPLSGLRVPQGRAKTVARRALGPSQFGGLIYENRDGPFVGEPLGQRAARSPYQPAAAAIFKSG